MQYFHTAQLQALANHEREAQTPSTEMQDLIQRMQDLHTKIIEFIQVNNLDLHVIGTQKNVVGDISVSVTENTDNLLCVSYLRSKGNAVNVERLMGREEVASTATLKARRHPVIEIRLTPSHLSVELILSPDAWWDQQNLIGKLTVMRHKQEFYTRLRELGSRYKMGFWQGVFLSEMHLSAHQFQHPRIMDEWMSTFEPGADYWRIGVWYQVDESELAESKIVLEITNQMQALHTIYQYLLWESDNNFREFYSV